MPINNTENRRVRMTRRLIKDSLIQLLEKKPIEKVTISELCKLADINRSTFYNHYESQYDVLNDIGEEIADTVIQSVELKLDSSSINLKDQVRIICEYLNNNREESRFLFRNFTAEDNLVQRILLKRITDGHTQYSNSIQSYDSLTQKLLFSFLTHGIYNLIRTWILEDIPKSPEEIGALAADIALNGWLMEETRG